MDVVLYKQAEQLVEYQKAAMRLKIELENGGGGVASEEDNHGEMMMEEDN